MQKAAHFAIHRTFLMALMLHRRNQIEEERRRRSFEKLQRHLIQ